MRDSFLTLCLILIIFGLGFCTAKNWELESKHPIIPDTTIVITNGKADTTFIYKQK
jgi:hypothetical protein